MRTRAALPCPRVVLGDRGGMGDGGNSVATMLSFRSNGVSWCHLPIAALMCATLRASLEDNDVAMFEVVHIAADPEEGLQGGWYRAALAYV